MIFFHLYLIFFHCVFRRNISTVCCWSSWLWFIVCTFDNASYLLTWYSLWQCFQVSIGWLVPRCCESGWLLIQILYKVFDGPLMVVLETKYKYLQIHQNLLWLLKEGRLLFLDYIMHWFHDVAVIVRCIDSTLSW